MEEKEIQKLEEKKQREMTARHTMSHVLAGAIKSLLVMILSLELALASTMVFTTILIWNTV